MHPLVERKLGAPILVVMDGNPGLAAALTFQWLASLSAARLVPNGIPWIKAFLEGLRHYLV